MFTVKNIPKLVKHSDNKYISKHIDTDMLIKLFFGVVLEKMLLTSCSNYVTSTTLQAVHDLEILHDIDWSYLVYECLKKACSEFSKNLNNMNGCVAVLMVSIYDLLKVIAFLILGRKPCD